MLRDKIALFTKLSGRDGEHTPIGVIGAYLDGYEKGCEDAKAKYERPHGKWIKLPRYEGDTQPDFKCDKCGYEITYFSEDSFCARCGADMRGDKE